MRMDLDFLFFSFFFFIRPNPRKRNENMSTRGQAPSVVLFGGTCRTAEDSKGRTIHSRAGRKLLNWTYHPMG